MSLQQRIQSDLTTAMKAREKERTSALRMVIAEMKNAAVAAGRGPQGELSDVEVERILAREVKRRQDSAASFRDGGREDRAEAEEREAAIYAEYLPEELSEEELLAIVEEAIATTGATGPSDVGAVMKEVMPRIGQRAPGQRVSAMVRSKLSSA